MDREANNIIFFKKIFKVFIYSIIFVISFYLLYRFTGYINKNIHIDALYMDDLYYWSFYGEGESFKEFCFPETASTFRPVFWALSYIQMDITKSDVTLYLKYNLLLNAIIAGFIFYASLRLSKSCIVGLLAGGVYLSSYFSYYQIGQMIGTIESYALLFGIIVVYNLVFFLKKQEKYIINIVIAYIFFFLAIFTHERYIGLIVPILFAIIFKIIILFCGKQDSLKEIEKSDEKKIEQKVLPIVFLTIIPIISIALFIVSRNRVIGTFIPTGTGRYDVVESFSLEQCMKFAIDQVKYLFGFNAGEAYLSAQNFESLNDLEQTVIYKAVVPLLIVVVIYLLVKIIYIFIKKNFSHLVLDIIFLSAIAMFIASSSITIRIEMRWIYVSYATAILYLAYMLGFIRSGICEIVDSKSEKVVFSLKVSTFVFIISLMTFFAYRKYDVDKIYRSYYPNIYFFEDQTRMNNLANMTIQKYGVDNFIGKKNVYILYNLYGMTDFYARWFYRPFKYGWDGSGTRIYFINDITEIPDDKKTNAIVLMESIDNKTYIEVEK